MWCERIDGIDDPRVADYRNVPDPELLRARGVFIAEGREVVRTLVSDSPFEVLSVMVSPAALEGLRDIVERRDDFPIFLASPEQIAAVAGFNVHRGCLALGRRPAERSHRDVLESMNRWRLLVVCEHVANADNMGGLFRNAAAFGAGAVLASPRCCDPLYRKSVRVSSGASLRIPFGIVSNWPDGLGDVRAAGYTILALSPDASLPDFAQLAELGNWPERIALLVGHEGHGLSTGSVAASDMQARIAMQPGVDSLNLATAAGIAMYFCARRWGGIMQM
jgi:tRNA G18 (ribose-2'-O)-methylase SpoU